MHARRAAEDRQRAATARLRLVISAQSLGGPAVLRHRLGMPRRVDPVLQRQVPDLDRREQRAKLVGHSLPSFRPAPRGAAGADTLPLLAMVDAARPWSSASSASP